MNNLMKITIKDCCKLLNVTESKFYYYLRKEIIPEPCDKIKCANGHLNLWDESKIIETIPIMKNYKRGQVVTKDQKKYNNERVKRLSSTDKYSPIFKQFLFDHVRVTPTAEITV